MTQQYPAAYTFAKGSKEYNVDEAEKMKERKVVPCPGMYKNTDKNTLPRKTQPSHSQSKQECKVEMELFLAPVLIQVKKNY